MESKTLLERILVELLKTEQLKRWTTDHDESGGTTLKIKFVKPMSDKREAMGHQNSDFHFYRKSGKRFTRDVNRAKQNNMSKPLGGDANSVATVSNEQTSAASEPEPESDPSDASTVQSNESETPLEDSEVTVHDQSADTTDVKLAAPTNFHYCRVVSPGVALPRVKTVTVAKPKEQKRVWRQYPESHRNAWLNVTKADKLKSYKTYSCETCKLSVKELSPKGVDLAFCRMCTSRNGIHFNEYVCANCYGTSHHASKNCYMSLMDISEIDIT